MHAATLKTPPFFLRLPTKHTFLNHKRLLQIEPKKENTPKSSLNPLNFTQNPMTAKKLQSLVTEFKSLPEPIDRVKRLLHYAALLPPLDESTRVESNQVRGCTTQVWLESRMDSDGLMRFRADSDSEITKGFCSCLIWVLDGAAPEEVAAVTAEDLADMNVGFSGRAQSRVNTWSNVLMSMQKRTRDLVEERERVVVVPPPPPPSEHFPALVVSVDAQERVRTPGVAQLS